MGMLRVRDISLVISLFVLLPHSPFRATLAQAEPAPGPSPQAKKKTIVDYFVASLPPRNESDPPRQFKIKDIEKGYVATQFEQAALYSKKDRTPVLVINHHEGDPPEVKAFEMVNQKWKERTQELLPRINQEDYIVARLRAKGLAFILDSYRELAEEFSDKPSERPVRVELKPGLRTIDVVAHKGPDQKPIRPPKLLYRYVFENDGFGLKEN
jgi:hypothetical protein